MYGFYGRILVIDLTQQSFCLEGIEEDILRRFLGGKGLGSYLLAGLNPQQADPLSPENCLIFATGPACFRHEMILTRSPVISSLVRITSRFA
ncbi:MAG: hypothetical protein HWN68_00065 [Desulfobacterales bacterium]|nr:hypothetical protein [Desulfobacterales bacterium]